MPWGDRDDWEHPGPSLRADDTDVCAPTRRQKIKLKEWVTKKTSDSDKCTGEDVLQGISEDADSNETGMVSRPSRPGRAVRASILGSPPALAKALGGSTFAVLETRAVHQGSGFKKGRAIQKRSGEPGSAQAGGVGASGPRGVARAAAKADGIPQVGMGEGGSEISFMFLKACCGCCVEKRPGETRTGAGGYLGAM